MSVDTKQLRIIDPNPRLATLLAGRTPQVIPQEFYDWGVQWVADVGSNMRSREFMVSMISFTLLLEGMSFGARHVKDTRIIDTIFKKFGGKE